MIEEQMVRLVDTLGRYCDLETFGTVTILVFSPRW